MILVPDCDLGLFISANATGGIDTSEHAGASVLRPVLPESGDASPGASGPASPLPTVTLTARLHQVTLLVGLSTLVGFCGQWNLIGWQYG